MIASDVQICQEALAVIRQDVALAPDSYTTPSTKVEKACKRAYDPSRRAFLALHDWNFARASAAYSTTRPAAIRILDVQDADGVAVQWKLNGTALAAAATAAKTVYTQDVVDVAGWPPLARSAFVLYLARELAILVTGRTQDLEAANALFSERFNEARVADLNEGDPADDEAHEVLALVRNRVDFDQSKLANTIECCNRRLGLFKRAAAAEVVASHNWTTEPTGYSTLPPLAQAAALVLTAQKIAAHVGAGVEAASALAQLYELKLQKARMKDLADATVSDAFQKEVLAILLANFDQKDGGLAFDIAAYTDRVEAVKSDSAQEIASAHEWATAFTAAATTHAAYPAFLYLVCAKLGATVGVGPEHQNALMEAYARKLAAARVKDLYAHLSANTDPVLAEIVAQFKENDPGLETCYTVYTARSAAVKTEAKTEIDGAHRWANAFAATATAHVAYPAFVALCVAKLAAPMGLDAASLHAVYERKLQRARIRDLVDSPISDGVTKEILATIQGNYSNADDALPLDVTAFTGRVEAVKDTVRDSILSLHHWNFARKTADFTTAKPPDCVRVLKVVDAGGRPVEWSVAGRAVSSAGGAKTVYTATSDPSGWPAPVKSAYVAAVAAEIVQTCVPDAGAAAGIKKALDQLAEKRLVLAKVADLNEDGSGAGIVREVKAVLKADYRASDGDLDEASDAIALRVGELLEPARREVLGVHNWNFARVAAPVACAPTGGGAFMFARPSDAARITAVRSRDGGLSDWTVHENRVVTREPAASVTYLRDVEDVEEWPPLVRRALVYRLAADAALSLPGRGRDSGLFLQLYREKIQEACVADAREGNVGRAAWGRSRFVEAISGRGRRGRPERGPGW